MSSSSSSSSRNAAEVQQGVGSTGWPLCRRKELPPARLRQRTRREAAAGVAVHAILEKQQ
jgi:hypothetical protein